MQITPLPTPPTPNVVPQDNVAKSIPYVQAQASAPMLQRAVPPSPKSERGNQTRSNGDRAKGGGSSEAGDKSRGQSVNIRV